jgi:ABC-type dipeptide/oligopeptide/nickel transport system permease subunit
MLDPRSWGRFKKNRGALVGVALVVLLLLFAILGPVLAHHDPYVSHFQGGVDMDTATPVGPSSEYLLGTDRIFRDQLARLAVGARLSLLIAFFATAIASTLGAAVGILAGYYEGSTGVRLPWPLIVGLVAAFVLALAGMPKLVLPAATAGVLFTAIAVQWRLGFLLAGPLINADTVLMRIVDIGLSFPFLLLVMAIAAAIDRTTVGSILAVLGLTGWLGTARILRAKTLQVRGLDFVVAARALGQRTPSILVRHILPNVAGPLIVISTVSVAQMILAESVLSYLGVGIAPPTPTWGHMLFEGQDYYVAAPWLLIAPAVAILAAVFGFNLVGEGLRDALDPRED